MPKKLKSKKIKINNLVFASPIFIGIFADIVFIQGTSDFRILLAVIYWLVLIRFLRNMSRMTIYICFYIFCLFAYYYMFFGIVPATERAATWLYIYLLLSVLQQLWEKRKR